VVVFSERGNLYWRGGILTRGLIPGVGSTYSYRGLITRGEEVFSLGVLCGWGSYHNGSIPGRGKMGILMKGDPWGKVGYFSYSVIWVGGVVLIEGYEG
jgi:hypothetical protein